VDWKEIKDHFRPMGSVCYVTFKNGQGVVQFENEEGLLNALKTADGSSIRGSVITVTRLPSSNAGAASSSDAGLQRSPSPRQADSPGAR
jgi:RNA recognition motif-containing protein